MKIAVRPSFVGFEPSMLTYMIQRVLILIPMLLVISFLVYLGT